MLALLALLLAADPPPLVDPALAALPPCAAQELVSTKEWQPATSPDGDLTILLPAGFEQVKDAWFVHGGTAWASGETSVAVAYGHWGLSSFGELASSCRTTVDGMHAIFMTPKETDRFRRVVWFAETNRGGHEIMLSLGSASPADPQRLLTIARTARRSHR